MPEYPSESGNGWGENKLLVRSELERLSDTILRIEEKLDKVLIENAGLKVKVGLISTIYGVVGGGITLLLSLSFKLFAK